jgi:hypothetical protein
MKIRIPCYLEFDERTNTVTMRHAKTNTIQMMIKLEAGMEGTMTRIDADCDCDNFWIATKPSDSAVFQDRLFDGKKLRINSIDYSLIKGE